MGPPPPPIKLACISTHFYSYEMSDHLLLLALITLKTSGEQPKLWSAPVKLPPFSGDLPAVVSHFCVEGVNVAVMIILKCMLKEQNTRAWRGFSWLRAVSSGRALCTRWHTRQRIAWPAGSDRFLNCISWNYLDVSFWIVVFVPEMTCVYCAVPAERLYNIQVSLHVEEVVLVEGPASSRFGKPSTVELN
jgi:hypothetical protein